jgi:hypothetical protein
MVQSILVMLTFHLYYVTLCLISHFLTSILPTQTAALRAKDRNVFYYATAHRVTGHMHSVQ